MEPWALVHGFYATMGGYGFRINKFHDTQILTTPGTKEICFLNSEGLNLVTLGGGLKECLPPVTEQSIASNSRASAVAKCFVCLQVVWFIAQCITRREYLCRIKTPKNGQNLMPWASHSVDSDKLIGAQHFRSRYMCVAHICPLVGQALRR